MSYTCRHPQRLLCLLGMLCLLLQARPLSAQVDTAASVASVVEQASLLTLQTDELQFNTLLLPEAKTPTTNRLGMQMPLAVGALGWGCAPFFSSEFRHQRWYVREEVQLWRRNTMNDRHCFFEDYTLYLPVVAAFTLNLAGVESEHDIWSMSRRTASSYLLVGVTVQSLKYSVEEIRPDRANYRSFPSGHTAAAFAGAEILRQEYAETSIWIPVAGYTVAALTGFMRVYNDRHWFTDVLAGAGIGILGVDLAYWINDLIFKEY